MNFAHSQDRGNQAQGWIICSDVGGRSFLHDVAAHATQKRDVPIWCASLEKAKRFKTIGALAQVLAFIPSEYEAYEEDPRFIDRHSL